MLSNLHSFHFDKLLQNACALPGHVYKDSNNKKLLSDLKTRGNNMTTTASPFDSPDNPETDPFNHPRTSPEQQKTAPVATQNAPESPAPIASQQKENKKQVWKPGRGVIEKVDRMTGEIVHLCTE
ncbi:MAG: hypothetical protein R3F02_08880 [Thiolinea sp.]